MSQRTMARREKLRDDLIDIAERLIADGGLEQIKARPLAEAAGCSVGAIYNVFPDLTALIMGVNGRTFRNLGKAVSQAVAGRPDATPQDQLVLMSMAYVQFASDNRFAWRTLFDLEMSAEEDVPQWYLAELGQLFALIAGPLRDIAPDAQPDDIDLLTRTLFSSVHGVTLLGLERRISGVPLDRIEAMVDLLIRRVAAP